MRPSTAVKVLTALLVASLGVLLYLVRVDSIDEAAGQNVPDEPVLFEVGPIYKRIMLKEEIARGLAHGTLTLQQATARVKALSLSPAVLQTLCVVEPGRSIDESLGRHILGWAALVIRDEQGIEASDRARLRFEGELQKLFGSAAEVAMPPPCPATIK